jgi:cyclopropane-fatty-acyl-phospholipid synthase
MQVADVIGSVLGSDLPVRVLGYDGSKAGPDTAETALRITSPRALARLATAPGSLGLARGYVTGELEIEGDIYTLLEGIADVTLHSLPRAEHHYDVSNTFYEWVLGPSMAYTCAVYPTAEATLEQAQTAKFELVAQKLGLTAGMRLLDVGCGWGSMVMHAAAEHGVRALGVTLSRNQAEWAQREIERRGLAHLAEVRHLDYRDITETGFDAVSSIGLTEHIGRAQLAGYFRFLHSRLRPEGRLLNHCITQPRTTSARKVDPFIDRYVFPDGQLHAIGHLITQMNDNGFEIRHEENLREHYAMTLRDWGANLDAHWEEAVAEVGEGRARVWRLYMAACRLGFARDNIQLHQVLGEVVGPAGESGFPLRGW